MSTFLLIYIAIGAIFATWFWFKQRIVRGATLEEWSDACTEDYDAIPPQYRDVPFLRFMGTPTGLVFVHGVAWPLVVCVTIRDMVT